MGNPRVLPQGAKDTLLFGDPGKNEEYVFRFKLPKEFKIEPFVLSANCFLAIIEGEVFIGEGCTFLINSMKALSQGSFCYIPTNNPIYLITKGSAILQFHGVGPIDFVSADGLKD